MRRIGITVAMESELRLLEGGLGLEAHKGRGGFIFRRGEYAGAEVTASLSGIGKVNSAICAAAMIEEFDLDCLVSTGVCGTLRADGSIVQKDLILASSVIYHDVWCGTPNAFGQVQGGPPFYDLSLPGIRGLESALSGLGYTVHTGRMASGDWFVDSAQKAAEIAATCPEALGVDMESGSLAQACLRYALPFLSVRMVSDAPLCPGAPAYSDFWAEAPGLLNGALKAVLDHLISA